MEMGVKPQVDNRLDDQSIKIQKGFDSFERRITRQLEGFKAPDLAGFKVEIAELRKLVNELHERLIFHILVITEIQLAKKVKSIQGIKTKEGRKKKENKKKEEIEYRRRKH